MIHGLLEILFRVLKDQKDFVLGRMILWVKFVCFYSDVIMKMNFCFLAGCTAHEGKHKLRYLGQDKKDFFYFNFWLSCFELLSFYQYLFNEKKICEIQLNIIKMLV